MTGNYSRHTKELEHVFENPRQTRLTDRPAGRKQANLGIDATATARCVGYLRVDLGESKIGDFGRPFSRFFVVGKEDVQALQVAMYYPSTVQEVHALFKCGAHVQLQVTPTDRIPVCARPDCAASVRPEVRNRQPGEGERWPSASRSQENEESVSWMRGCAGEDAIWISRMYHLTCRVVKLLWLLVGVGLWVPGSRNPLVRARGEGACNSFKTSSRRRSR